MIEGFRLKLTKCIFAADAVKYLGHIIKCNSISPLKDNLISIRDFPMPKTQKNVRQFLGKINFYNKYIPNNSIKLETLHNLLRKGQKFVWSEECQISFKHIKKLLCSQPILAIFDPNLLKKRYNTGNINSGKKFTVFSDHKPLEKLNIKARTDEELGDLTYYVSQYNFEIKYAPGKYNLEADCLSRNPVLEPDEKEDEALQIVNLIKLEDIQKDQKENNELKNRIGKMKLRNNI